MCAVGAVGVVCCWCCVLLVLCAVGVVMYPTPTQVVHIMLGDLQRIREYPAKGFQVRYGRGGWFLRSWATRIETFEANRPNRRTPTLYPTPPPTHRRCILSSMSANGRSNRRKWTFLMTFGKPGLHWQRLGTRITSFKGQRWTLTHANGGHQSGEQAAQRLQSHFSVTVFCAGSTRT